MSDPPVIAIMGASSNRSKFGNKSVRAYLRAGWNVIPVNPKPGTIEGLDVATSVSEISPPLERVSVYLPPPLLLGLLPEIAAKGCNELWLNPGTHNAEVLRVAQQLGLNVVAKCSIVDVGFSPDEFPEE